MTTDIDKFLKCLNKFIDELGANHNLPVHTNINQFYYMQKIEELKLLKEQLNEAVKRMNFFEENFETKYREVFVRWRKDARWLNQYRVVSMKDARYKSAL